MLGTSDLWLIRERAADYHRRFEAGEVTTLAYDICGIDIPVLLADETELRAALTETQTVMRDVFGLILRSDWKGKDARAAVMLLERALGQGQGSEE